ncbi:MAG TPA: hypothetical protein VHT91_49130 [Kofleriaceae bacterium]|jgi:hypothetical protein|nr:hypothetical protein [Kofleriaceae bacterium]
MRGWIRRTAELRGELAALAGDDLRWWLLAGGAAVAERWPARPGYLASDAEPGADTFIGHRAALPADPLRDAIDRARAARTALRDLDGTLPDQPLAVTIARGGRAIPEPSALDTAAFAIGPHCVIAALDDPTLLAQLAAAARGTAPPPWRGPTPFVCVSIGDDPIETARHGHRRAWRDGRGPWLGLGRAGELATVSTCHLVVDGYGHATLTGRIHALLEAGPRGAWSAAHHAHAHPHPHGSHLHAALPALAPVAGAVPLGVAWQELVGPGVRALPLAYAVGRILHQASARSGARSAPFSPTLQIPVAPGRLDDPERRRRRATAAIVSVRFAGGEPEPLERFEARARGVVQRETLGVGLCARLLAAARAAPAPLAWKRRGFSAARPRWLDRVSEVLGGRACVSRIRIDTPVPPSCAVSAPSRHASPGDPLGACVVTVVDDGDRAAITVCGSGLAGSSAGARGLLDAILALTAEPGMLRRAVT